MGFHIRSSTLRLGIFISTVIIAIIVIFQLAWLKKVYQFEQKEFDHSIVKTIRGLYEDLEIPAYNSTPLNQLVERAGEHLYLARITQPVSNDSLKAYLQYELEDFGIFTDCQLGVYNAGSDGYQYTTILASTGTKENSRLNLPIIQKSYDYIALSFPNRQSYILSQMNFWIVTSAVLLITLVLLSGSLYYFYRQKFLNETQKDFIHNFAHEFKTPVSVIRLAADVIKEKSPAENNSKLATYADMVAYQADYLHSQIERLLKFAHTESRHIHLVKEPVDIHALLHEAVTNLDPVVSRKKAALHYDLSSKHPTLQADRGYLLIVIINLLDNAFKYSREPAVTISTEDADNSLRLSIKDNGIGIDKKNVGKLFQKFYRVRQGETYMAKGFGIGLTFVKKIVDAHKGKIYVESSPGKGSNFIIEIPVAQKQVYANKNHDTVSRG